MGGKTIGPAFIKAGDAKNSDLHKNDQVADIMVKDAVAAGAFRLNFQPTVNLDEGDAQYFEVRCGLAFGADSLSGRQLFDIVNKQQLGSELDRWIITRVFKLLQLHNQPNLNLSVWISRNSIQDSRFIDWIDSQLRDSETLPEQVIFQISEQDALAEENETEQFCLSLKGMGFSICLVEQADELNGVATSGGLPRYHTRDLSQVLPKELPRDLPMDLPRGLPQGLPLDYLKLAPEAIHHIERESRRRLHLKKRVGALNRRGIRVIAAQLDDILLLPILWKARVDFVQGNCLRAPAQHINISVPHHQTISLN